MTSHHPSSADAQPIPGQSRLPSFLLGTSGFGSGGFSSSPTRGRFSGDQTDVNASSIDTGNNPTWPFQPSARRSVGLAIAFNDRLRTDSTSNSISDPSKPAGTPNVFMENDPPTRTPARMPPNRSLLDSGSPSVLHLRTPGTTPGPTPGSFARTSARFSSPPAPTSGTHSSVQGENRCVTVFGFPPDLESQTLREFRRHGDIVRAIPGRGNWVHLLYRTPLQAQVALYKPWRVLAGTDVMVGVVPCTEPDVAKEIDQAVEHGVLIASPANFSTPSRNKDSFAPNFSSPSPARPGLPTPSSVLRREQGNSQSTASSIVRTPQRQTGILDYITGFYK